ncbi:MAG: peptidoglycan DD-metalloendopeptidase family protein [Cyanobacteria bacterium J06627_8]
MKRIFQRKVSLKLGQVPLAGTADASENLEAAGLQEGSRKSMAALGLAVSVVASGLLLDQGGSRAMATEIRDGRTGLFDAQSLSNQSSPSPGSGDVLSIYRPITVARASQAISQVNASASGGQHIVREGDTLWSIARQYQISDATLVELNGLSSDNVLKIGQVLTIPHSSKALKEIQDFQETESLASELAGRNLAQLQVQNVALSSSESRSRQHSDIQNSQFSEAETALREEAVAQLRRRREQLRASLISIRSEDLTTPPSVEEVESSKSSAEIVRALSSESDRSRNWIDSLEGISPSTDGNSSYITYEIQRGDTLAAIAREHNVLLSEIVEANSISNPNRVFVGQTLRIPSQAASPAQADVSSPEVDGATTLQVTPEVLVGALPSTRFGTTSSLPGFRSAPSVPLPVPEQTELSVEVDDASDSYSDFEAMESEVTESQSENLTDSSIAEEATPQSESDTYVEELIQDIEEISETEQSVMRQELLEELDQISQENSDLVAYRPDGSYIDEQGAINPEFNAEFIQTDESEQAGLPAPQSTDISADNTLIAVAPLGAENYSSPAQPATGRVVSPDLPPLPGAENFVPSSEATFDGYLWPARGVLTSGYGWRWGRMHQGIDIAAPVGTPIYAAAPGVVEFSGWNSGGYGNMVDIRHPDGSKTRYAHNSRNLVRVGQRVAQGHQIAEMGSTGYSTGPHVHFEIHIADRGAINPIALLQPR